MSARAKERTFADALGELKTRISMGGAPKPSRVPELPTRLASLAQAAGLDGFEANVLLLAALPVLEPDAGQVLATAQGDTRLSLPTVAFALSSLAGGHWRAFAPASPLRAKGLIDLTEEPIASARALMLPERVLHHLVGLDSIDGALISTSTPITTKTSLAASQSELAQKLGNRIATDSPDQSSAVFELIGSDRSLAARLASAAVEAAGRSAYLIDSEALPQGAAERSRLALLWSREALLAGSVCILDTHDGTTPAELRAAARFAASIDGPVIVLAAEPLPLAHRLAEKFAVPRSSASEQEALWTDALGPLAATYRDEVLRLVAHFTASPDTINRVAALAAQVPAAANSNGAADVPELLWTETRARCRPRLDELAQRIDSTAGWDALVLPQRQLDVLKGLAAQVRQRAKVYEGWGFGAGNSRGLGISALFAGPSGTGKTLAAEVIGAALSLDVYRIDLSAVVSKWIGETEKNLRRIFDAAEDTSAILLFDECDSLFGRRAEVKESHDRYANIEVSYLLQRMETYRGLAILTTNLRSHIDTAFLRRIRFMIDFPLPGETERRDIWRLVFPQDAPQEGLDLGRLAQLNVAGGSIKNIALNAAFIAADSGAPIGMGHVRSAARAEYEKLGKPLTDGELRGWQTEARHG